MCNMALRILVLAVVISLACLAQGVAVGLSSGVASPGTPVTLALTLNATGSAPASAQWTLEYSPADFSSVTVTAGPAATTSGKTVTCNPTSGTTTCVLWGMDATAIVNGVVANVSLTVSESTLANSSGVQLVNCLAASPEGNALSVSSKGGGVSLPRLITANPNPIPTPSGAPGQTLISWSALGSSGVEVRVGSAAGTLFASGGPTGSAQTGDWVTDGTVFVLVDATTHAVLSATTVSLTAPGSSSTIAASPNPIPVAAGATAAQTTITWNAPGFNGIEVHVGTAAGTLFASGGPSGSAPTGNWVTDGLVFVLMDEATHAVLATTTVMLAGP